MCITFADLIDYDQAMWPFAEHRSENFILVMPFSHSAISSLLKSVVEKNNVVPEMQYINRQIWDKTTAEVSSVL